jgi:hypothetical protein
VKWSLASFIWLLAYLLFLALIAGGVFYGRSRALAVYGSGEAQAQWDTWRADAKKMAEAPHPVKRRIPGSAEPPALVLMRDYFAICLGGSLVLSTVLFATFMMLVRGALTSAQPRSPNPEPRTPEP